MTISFLSTVLWFPFAQEVVFLYINVWIRVPFRMWLDVMRWSLTHRIHPKLVWTLICDHGFGIICNKD